MKTKSIILLILMLSIVSFAKLKFFVEFCANCDGGFQERDTAISSIKEAYPAAIIDSKQINNYPIEVKIFAGEGNEKLIFSSPQRNLFRKYPDLRTESIKQIKKIVKEYVIKNEKFDQGNFMMR
eukprot:TRINITY_DN4049_c0_g1_i1.p1 TRINITY_DN4049_c0_g1~~TRINITY_DN4049_c0_g1_i1.p1  ORF type:complete len:124 (-),score=27.04 TRINITY_DN4049_c0_g1_i1:67-438(-)